MAAVISGNGLGLFNTSLTQIGSQLGGSGRTGQGGDSQYVNVATGNLLLQSQDEQLLFRGLSVGQLRTYNSQGQAAQVGADGWMTGFERRVELLSGTLNAAGSVMRLHTGDGAFQDYTYLSANVYQSTAGGGAHDQLLWNGSAAAWRAVEGSSRREEHFADHADAALLGRLVRIVDAKSDGTTPAAWDVSYDASGRIAEVRSDDGTANGDALVFGYDASGRLATLSTRENGVLRGQVGYTYDSAGRLASVLVDLTPEDGAGDRETWDAATAANNNAYLFRTSYTYVDATSLRIAQVAHSDGTLVSYTYDANGRIRTVTQGDTNIDDADGAGQTLTFDYDAPNRSTHVSDSTGRSWTYTHDSAGQLVQIQAPAIDGQRDITRYGYDLSGNVSRITSERGGQILSQTDFQHDANGNVLWQWEVLDQGQSGSSRAIQRTYIAGTNQLASETTYTGRDPDGLLSGQAPTGGLTSNFVYDEQSRLRFVVTAAGEVREIEYATAGNGIGQASLSRQYLGEAYSDAYSLTDLTKWAKRAQKASSALAESFYDLNGRLSRTVEYASVDAAGSGIDDDSARITEYVYDAQGLLREQVALRSSNAAINDGRDTRQATSYSYDGMGRLLSETVTEKVGTAAASTLRSSTWAYLDSANSLRTTLQGGAIGDGLTGNDLLRTEVRNAAGRLIAVTESAVSGGTSRTAQNFYDTAGRLRASQDAGGGRSYFFYDAKGELQAQVDATGAMTEFVRDGLGRVVETLAYSERVDTTSWLLNGSVGPQSIDALRPGWSTTFDTLPPELNTAHVGSTTYVNAITHQDGRLAFRVSDHAATVFPSISSKDTHELTENVAYTAEVSTDALMSNTYLLFAIENTGTGTALKRVSAYFRHGALYKHTSTDGIGKKELLGSLEANTTYMVEAQMRDGSIEFAVYVKGQDRSTGFSFSGDAEAADWGAARLMIYSLMQPGVTGNALYLDNLAQTDLNARRTSSTYDGAGRLLTQVDPEGAITSYSYDGANRLLQVRTTDALGTAATARVTRYFHDAAGREIARLDPAGFLVEIGYDHAGRQVRSTAYATATPVAMRAAGTLAQLRPATSSADQITRTFHDGRGNVIAELDAEGYLTEFVHDQARNQRAVRSHALQLTGLSDLETLSSLRTQAQAGAVRETRRDFDARGLLITELNAEGTVTRYSYDAQGRLLKSEAAQATVEQRDGYRRYDVFGNLVGELGGEGAVQIVAGLSQAQIDAIYAQYGVRHEYDALGRRIESIDAEGNKTWYFHDAVGRLTQTVRGVADEQGLRNSLGEVTETRYTAFGEVRDTIAYTGRIAIAPPFGREQVAASVQVLQYLATSDSRTQFDYDRRGQLRQRLDALGNSASFDYNAFGNMTRQTVQIDGTRSLVTASEYDLRGLRTAQMDDVGGIARTQAWSYDAFGRVVSAVDGRGSSTSIAYDRLGRQVSQQQTVTGRIEQSQVAYDAWSRVLTQTDAMGRITRYAYDDAARSVVITTPEGVTLTTVRNRHGETQRVTDAKGNATAYSYNRDGQLTQTLAADGGSESRSYDARGQLFESTDATGRKVAYEYDAVGRVLSRIENPGGLNLTSRFAYDGQGRRVIATDPAGMRTTLAYDLKGQLSEVVRDADGLALKTRYSWDARGQQLTVSEGADTAAAQTTAYAYDTLGRRTSETAASGTLNLVTRYTYDSNDNVVARTDATGRITRYTYDEANRTVFAVDGAGGVVRQWYDRSGRVVASRAYAQAISATSLAEATTTAAVQALIVTNNARDTQQYQVHDQDGRTGLTIDGAGAVSHTVYDAAGRQVRQVRYANAVALTTTLRTQLRDGTATTAGVLAGITADTARDHDTFLVLDAVGRVRFAVGSDGSASEQRYDLAGRATQSWSYATALVLSAADRSGLNAGTLTAATLATRLAPQSGTARVQYSVYDTAGRASYSLLRSGGATAVASQNTYDAAGRVIAQRQFGVEVAFDPAQTAAELAALLPPSSETMRRTRFVYDTAGRLRFTLDPVNSVTESRYDAAGRVTESRTYGQTWSSGAPSEAALTTWAQGLPADAVRSTLNTYDSAGRLSVRTDALNQTERYAYDGAGLLTQYTDRNNAVWNYGYDGAGRRTSETSPSVTVATVNAAGSVSQTARRLITRIAYDGQGNVTARTENADTTEARQVQYVYDNRGNQVQTIFPDAWKVSETTGELVATGQTSTIDITYDTLGRAVVQKDVRDHYSYKSYDAQGRLAFEVDQEGFVTGFGYNAFGEQSSLHRYSTALNTGAMAGWTAGQPISVQRIQSTGALTPAAADRTITTSYDLRGNTSAVVQKAINYYNAAGTLVAGAPTTRFEHDAWGQLARESLLLEGTPGQANAAWADTFRYYDALGRNTLTVDAEGYATSTQYNATGEAIETIEHARALSTETLSTATRPATPAMGDAATGLDRITRWQYDALGRKEVETVVRRYQRADGSAGLRDVDTLFAYDDEGRVTGLTTGAGTTVTTYDALGRAVSVQEPVRATLTASAENSLLASTGTELNTAGLYAQVSPYTTIAYDAFGNAVKTTRFANGRVGTAAAVANAALDQVQVTRYDRQGRAVMTRDAEGALVYSSFDAADNVLHRWYRLGGSDTSRDAVVHGNYSYDKVGRQLAATQTRQPVAGGAAVTELSEQVTYNAFGEIDGKTHGQTGSLAYSYDAAGHLLTSNEGGAVRTYGYNLAGHQVRESHKAYLSSGQVIDAVTHSTTDGLGRTVAVRLPSHTDDNNVWSVLEQQFDRWGNVVQVLDPRGFQTNYQYNDFNQVIRDERPLVEVVSETGARSWLRPVNQWFYDAFGRLVGTRDANGNLRTNEYDATGRLLKSRDALGNATAHAYDAFGNQRMTQDPLGYLTFKQYDRQNRITGIGDYLPDATGITRAREVLQAYTLNQNGDRLSVTDALGYTARYDYDGSSQLLRSQTTTGVVADYAYDVQGRKVREGNALSGSTTLTDRDAESIRVNELTWDYDIHGRLIDHNNLSGRDYDYSYDAASGMQTAETGAGGAGVAGGKDISYYANGRIRSVVETGVGSTFSYEYDAAGNRTLEETRGTDDNSALTHTITRTLYDSHNRIARVTQDDLSTGTGKRVFDLLYAYDAVGNRRQVRALSGYGGDVHAVPVNNTAPTAIQTVSQKIVRTGLTSQFTLLFSDIFRDAEQDALTLSITQSSGAALPAWLSVQHDPATGELLFIAAPGSAQANTDVTVRLTARETANTGNAASTDFVVSVRDNTPPELKPLDIKDNPIRVKTDQPWNRELAVDDYFYDLDIGDQLTLSVVNPGTLPWAQVDASNPSVVRLSGTPTVAGTYSLQVRATDEKGASIDRTFQILTAPNSAPKVVAAPGATEAILGRQFGWTAPLASVFSDIDDDALQITASGMPAWMSFQHLVEQATPELKFAGQVPVSEVNGRVYTITLKAVDPDGAFITTTLSVTVRANRAPALVQPGGWTMPAIRVNDTVDLTVAMDTLFADPEDDQVFVEPIGIPSWLNVSVDQTARTIRFHGTPTSNAQAGALSFQLRGHDAEGLSNLANVSLNVGTDHPPVRNGGVALNDRWLSIGRNFSFTLPSGLFTDADPDDSLSLQAGAVVQDGNPAADSEEYWVRNKPLPSWMSFHSGTRTFYGTVPADIAPETLFIRVSATDGRNSNTLTSTQVQHVGAAGIASDVDFAIDFVPFVNSAPTYTAGSLPNRTLVHGGAVNFALPAGAFVEPDSDPLSYTALVQEPGHEEMRNVGTAEEPMFEKVWVEGDWVSLSTIGLSIDLGTGRITGTASNLSQTSYSARIIAQDPQGLATSGTFVFNVANTPPTATPIPTQNVGRNVAWNFAVTPYFSDVDVYNTLTYTATSVPAGLALSSAGTFTGAPSLSLALGDYVVQVKADDGRGGIVTSDFTIRLVNSAPVAPASLPNQTAPAGTAWSYLIPAFSDPNGDELTYVVTGRPSWMAFNTNRTLSGTPAPVGTWTITVTATDTSNVSTTRSFTVTTPNKPPTVATPIPAKSIGRNIPWSYTLPGGTFTDANNDPLTYTTGILPSGVTFHGTAFGGVPTVLGAHAITVFASDGRSASVSTSFVLNVVNNPPVYAKALPSRIGQQGQSVSWALPAGTFTDSNGDTLGYSALVEIPAHKEKFWNAQDAAWDLLWVDAQWVALSNAGLSIAANGTLSGPVRALTVTDAASQTYTFHGYRVQLTAKDPSGATAQGIFSVSINSAPTAPWISNKTIKSAVAWSFTVPAFTDANGDALSYSASGLPAGLAFNTSTRVISGTPTTAGTYTAKITANDGRGGVTNSSFTITVQANTAPTAPVIPNQSATTGIAFSYLVPAFSDANGDALTYSATGLPPGLSMSFRTISGTPTTAGSYTVTVTAKDGRGGTVSKAFTITVVNQPPPNRAPVVSTPLPDKWTLGTNYFNWTFPVGTFTDPDNNPLTYTASGQPSWLQFDAVNRRFYGAPSDGRYTQNWTITVTARDPAGLTVSDAFNLMKEGTGGGGTQPFAVEPPQGDPEYSFELDATPATSIPYQVVEHWYSYDAENRLKVNHGKLVNGQIVVDAGNNESHELLYDAAGRVVARYRELSDGGYVYRSAYNLRGEKTLEFHPEKIGAAPRGIGKGFSYYANGTLKETRSYYASGTTRELGTEADGGQLGTLDISGWLQGAEQLSYDGDGRTLQQITKHRTTTDWYALSRWGEDTTNQRTDLTALENRSAVYYSTATGGSGSGYDAAGRATTYRYRGADIGWATHTYTTTYEGWGSYQEKTVLGSSDNSTYRTTNNTLTYDAMGRLSSQREHTTGSPVDIDDRMRYYAYNGEGRVQMRRAGTMDGATFVQEADNLGRKDNALFVHAGGQQQAELKEGGKLQRADGSMYYSDQLVSLGGRGNFSAGGGKVAVQAGETLSTLAQRIYGSSQRWYVLADANGLSDPEKVLTAGTQLNAPNVNVSSNDAGTFKPYNPGDAIGSTSPGLPFIEPPPALKCGAMVRIISFVVQAIVTYYSGSAEAGAAAGNLAGQYSSMMFNGQYDWGRMAKFSANPFAGNSGDIGRQIYDPLAHGAPGAADYKSVAISAGAAYAQQYGGVVAGYATNYQLSKEAGYDVHWSNRELGALMATTAVSQVLPGLGNTTVRGGSVVGAYASATKLSWSELAKETMRNIVRSGIQYGARKAFGVQNVHWNWQDVAVDAFGNALGNAAVAGIKGWRANRDIGPVERQDFGWPNAGIAVDDLAIDIAPLSLHLNVDQSGNAGVSSQSGVRTTTRTVAVASNFVDSVEQQQYIAALNGYLQGQGQAPLSHGATYVEALNRYQELMGGPKVHNHDRVRVHGGTYDPVSDRSWWRASHTMDAGGGFFYRPELHNAYVQRTGEMPRYRPVQAATWMGTGSQQAWSAVKNQQTNQQLGVLAFPVAVLGTMAQSVPELIAFGFNVGKTALGTAGYLLSGGAVGADEFAATSRFVEGTGNFLWNSAGNTAYILSGGQLAQQEHAAYMGYVGAVGQGIAGLWDGTVGAWGRGDYVSSGATLGSFVGVPIPIAKLGVIDDVARAIPDGSIYSVAFEMTLDSKDFGRSDKVHFNRANAALYDALQADPDFAARMDQLIPGVLNRVSSIGGRDTPLNFTWHHDARPGVMQLAPTVQHTPGSIFSRTFHPDPGAAGGYALWAIPAGAPKRR